MSILEKEQLLNAQYIKWFGRYYFNNESKINTIYNSVSGFMVKVETSQMIIKVSGTNYQDAARVPAIRIIVDGDFSHPIKYIIHQEIQDITINLDGKVHYVEFYKQSEAIRNEISIHSITVNGNFLDMDYHFDFCAEVIGDSTIAGYGNLAGPNEEQLTITTDALQDFSFLGLKKLNAEVHTVSSSGWGVYASRWTVPMETNVVEYKDKVAVLQDKDWDYQLINPQVVLFSLGTNDMTYIYLDEKLTEERLQAFYQQYVNFIEYKIKQYPQAKILITYGACKDVRTFPHIEHVYEILHQKHQNVYILHVDGDSLSVGGHPSLEAHYRMGNQVAEKIKEILK